MTVETTTNVTVTQCNGATVDFPFNFKVIDENDLVIQRRVLATGLVDKTYSNSEVTVTGIGDAGGGTVTISPALADGYEIVLSRDVSLKQELDIVNQGGFFPETVEQQLDLMEMQIQQIREKADRSIGTALGDNLNNLPGKLGRANQYLVFDADGNPAVSTGTGADAGIRTDLASTASGKGAALVETERGGTVQDALDRLPVYLEQYGGGTGVADNRAAFVAALAALDVAGGGVLQLGAGNYNVA